MSYTVKVNWVETEPAAFILHVGRFDLHQFQNFINFIGLPTYIFWHILLVKIHYNRLLIEVLNYLSLYIMDNKDKLMRFRIIIEASY